MPHVVWDVAKVLEEGANVKVDDLEEGGRVASIEFACPEAATCALQLQQ